MYFEHHFALVLPYVPDTCEFFLEVKGDDYKKPYYQNGLSLIGGNCSSRDSSPREILDRELREEFCIAPELVEHQEADFNNTFGFTAKEGAADCRSPGIIERIQRFYDIIMPKARHTMTVVCNICEPVVRTSISYTGSIYCAPLTLEEMGEIQKTSSMAQNKISLENITYGSSMQTFSLESLSEQKFAWEQQLLFGMVLKRCIPELRVCKELEEMFEKRPGYYDISEIEELRDSSDPTKNDLMKLGYRFKYW